MSPRLTLATEASGTTKPPRRAARSLRGNSKRSLLMIFHTAKFLMRADEIRRGPADGDLDRARIAMAVWLQAMDHLMAKDGFATKNGNINDRLNFDGVPPTTASALAIATGIPRETVRRKLKALEADGFVCSGVSGRYTIGTSPVTVAKIVTAMYTLYNECIRFMNTCANAGALHIENRSD